MTLQSINPQLRRRIASTSFIIGFFVFWEVACIAFGIKDILLPRPTQIVTTLFDRLPDIRIVTHHLGAMIPYFEGRVGYGLDQFGTRTPGEDYSMLLRSLPRRPVDYFRMFWADTAVFGSRGATECGAAAGRSTAGSSAGADSCPAAVPTCTALPTQKCGANVGLPFFQMKTPSVLRTGSTTYASCPGPEKKCS